MLYFRPCPPSSRLLSSPKVRMPRTIAPEPNEMKAAANGVLGHLTDGSRAAQTATGFEPGSGAASEMQALQDGLAEGVRVLRDGTVAGTVSRADEGRQLIDAAYEDHYEQALGQMAQVPLGGVVLPCL